jgi:hypothetical protein
MDVWIVIGAGVVLVAVTGLLVLYPRTGDALQYRPRGRSLRLHTADSGGCGLSQRNLERPPHAQRRVAGQTAAMDDHHIGQARSGGFMNVSEPLQGQRSILRPLMTQGRDEIVQVLLRLRLRLSLRLRLHLIPRLSLHLIPRLSLHLIVHLMFHHVRGRSLTGVCCLVSRLLALTTAQLRLCHQSVLSRLQ